MSNRDAISVVQGALGKGTSGGGLSGVAGFAGVACWFAAQGVLGKGASGAACQVHQGLRALRFPAPCPAPPHPLPLLEQRRYHCANGDLGAAGQSLPALSHGDSQSWSQVPSSPCADMTAQVFISVVAEALAESCPHSPYHHAHTGCSLHPPPVLCRYHRANGSTGAGGQRAQAQDARQRDRHRDAGGLGVVSWPWRIPTVAQAGSKWRSNVTGMLQSRQWGVWRFPLVGFWRYPLVAHHPVAEIEMLRAGLEAACGQGSKQLAPHSFSSSKSCLVACFPQLMTCNVLKPTCTTLPGMHAEEGDGSPL